MVLKRSRCSQWIWRTIGFLRSPLWETPPYQWSGKRNERPLRVVIFDSDEMEVEGTMVMGG